MAEFAPADGFRATQGTPRLRGGGASGLPFSFANFSLGKQRKSGSLRRKGAKAVDLDSDRDFDHAERSASQGLQLNHVRAALNAGCKAINSSRLVTQGHRAPKRRSVPMSNDLCASCVEHPCPPIRLSPPTPFRRATPTALRRLPTGLKFIAATVTRLEAGRGRKPHHGQRETSSRLRMT